MPPSSDRSIGAAAARLRILIVTDEMEVGGSQRQIVNLALGLASGSRPGARPAAVPAVLAAEAAPVMTT